MTLRDLATKRKGRVKSIKKEKKAPSSEAIKKRIKKTKVVQDLNSMKWAQ